ncbi:MAG: ABC transporter ATP-binding protein [Trueperaceae bacterium]|nr:ABC transporter ATP-binding protein [Trueperaceae bacterium]
MSNTTKRYGRVIALNDVNFEVRSGELFALLGPNGAGKTTLIHILCTIHGSDEGRTEIFGVDTAKHPRRARRHLGVVFQEPSLDGRLTVAENLDFHGRIYGVPGALRRQRIPELLELVELAEWRDHLVSQLSTGMKRRLEIARALVHDSKLLILDEPTVGLDAQTRERMWVYLQRLRRERDLTVLVTTHYIDEVEVCDRICIVDHGEVLALDTPERLKQDHGAVIVRVEPDDADAEKGIREAYPERVAPGAGGLVVEVGTDAEAERFVEAWGTYARTLTVEKPSLETVFLSLTGQGTPRPGSRSPR